MIAMVLRHALMEARRDPSDIEPLLINELAFLRAALYSRHSGPEAREHIRYHIREVRSLEALLCEC